MDIVNKMMRDIVDKMMRDNCLNYHFSRSMGQDGALHYGLYSDNIFLYRHLEHYSDVITKRPFLLVYTYLEYPKKKNVLSYICRIDKDKILDLLSDIKEHHDMISTIDEPIDLDKRINFAIRMKEDCLWSGEVKEEVNGLDEIETHAIHPRCSMILFRRNRVIKRREERANKNSNTK